MGQETSLNREKWVDIAKGIAMIAIVMGHIHYDYPNYAYFPISTFFFWLWHVPVFFIIGGFFIKEERLCKPLSFIWNKYIRIGTKVILISLPLIVLHNLLVDINFYDPLLSIGGTYIDYCSFIELLKKVVGTLIMRDVEVIVDPLWFAQVLFWALSFLSIVTWLLNQLHLNRKTFECTRFLLLFSFALVGNLLTVKTESQICPPPIR